MSGARELSADEKATVARLGIHDPEIDSGWRIWPVEVTA